MVRPRAKVTIDRVVYDSHMRDWRQTDRRIDRRRRRLSLFLEGA